MFHLYVTGAALKQVVLLKASVKPLSAVLLISLLTAIFCSSQAVAQEPAAGQKNWQFQIAPFYLWYFSVEGDQTVGNNTAEVVIDPGGLISKFNAAFTKNILGLF